MIRRTFLCIAACKEGNTDVVRTWLIRDRKTFKGGRLRRKTRWPLFLACENGHTEVAQLLLQ